MLSAKQRKCLDLMVLGTLPQREIAKEIKMSEQTICNWKKNEDFMSELEARIRSGIRSLAPKAMQTEEKLLNARSEMVRLAAAKDILDRAGYAPEENLNISGGERVVIVDNIQRGDKIDGAG